MPRNLISFDAVSQQNKEWKPKSSQKPNSNSPGVIGTPKNCKKILEKCVKIVFQAKATEEK